MILRHLDQRPLGLDSGIDNCTITAAVNGSLKVGTKDGLLARRNKERRSSRFMSDEWGR